MMIFISSGFHCIPSYDCCLCCERDPDPSCIVERDEEIVGPSVFSHLIVTVDKPALTAEVKAVFMGTVRQDR